MRGVLHPGPLAQAFAGVDGSGDWFRGGIVANQRSTNVHLLAVDPAAPLVRASVAEQMARGIARKTHGDVAIATVGAAGIWRSLSARYRYARAFSCTSMNRGW